jgi:uncharacterized membrane protein
MQLVPDWAPNIHPVIVHFPIALLFTGVGIDFLALVVRPWRWLRRAAVTIYVLAAVSLIVTYFTGKAAADSVTLPAEAQAVLTTHSRLAWWTMWTFGLYALVRLGTLFYERTRNSVWAHGGLFALALAALYLPYQTGDHGSMMVYKYGVGVQAAEVENPAEHSHDNGHGAAADSTSGRTGGGGGPQVSENGTWQWQPSGQAAEALSSEAFNWLAGEASALDPQVRSGSDGSGPALALTARQGRPAMFTTGGALRNLQADARLDLSGFDGTAMIVHHVQGAQNYDFVALEPSSSGGGTMRLGRVRGGKRSVSAEGSYAAQERKSGGMVPVRVVSSSSHYRGYVGGEMAAHGHAEAPTPGRVGLRLEGSGTVLLGEMRVQSLGDG